MYTVDLRFYINGVWERVDIDRNTTTFAFNMQFTDLENPPVTHAPFSVELTLPATKHNNQLFDNINKGSVVLNFNPLLRTDYVLHINQNVFQSGYFKLESFSLLYVDTISSYTIRLYGGLGDYMYRLSEIQLKELDFGDTFTHQINRRTVLNSWMGEPMLNLNGEDISDKLGYAMTYQGQYNNFDSDYVVNPTYEQSREVTWYNQRKNYTSVELDEHKRTLSLGEESPVFYGEYRSYYQKPMLKLSTIFMKIVQTMQAEGWTTELDSTFFNDSNPYWADTWIICPNYDSTVDLSELNMPLTGTNPVLTGENVGRIYLPEFVSSNELQAGSQYAVKVNLPFYIKAVYDGSPIRQINMEGELRIEAYLTLDGEHIQQLYSEGAQAGFIALNADTTTVKRPPNWGNTPDGSFYYGRYEGDYQANIGCNTRDCGSVYTFTSPIVTVDLTEATQNAHLGIEIHINGNTFWTDPLGVTYEYGVQLDLNNTDAVIEVSSEGGSGIRTDSVVTWKDIIQSEVSLKDFVLSYTKPFGLLFDKDVATKTVRIITRNTFFEKLEKLDWTYKVDYSRQNNIEPIPFNYKTGVFAWGALDTKYENDYKTTTSREYGSVHFDTNYEFGDEQRHFLEDNIFNNCIIATDYSQYYLDRTTKIYQDNKTLPHFKDNSESGVDINFVLVFRDGYLTTEQFLLTDDNTNMLALGYAWTTYFAFFVNRYPKLVRTIERAGQIYSLNFGRPSKNYNDVEPVGDDEQGTEAIFYRFWRRYLEDRFSQNSKRMIAWVNLTLTDLQGNLFSKFIYINNTLWVIDKIKAFNPLNHKTTQVELINVQDINNYIGQDYLHGRFIIYRNGNAIYDSDGELATDISPVVFNTSGTSSLTLSFESNVFWSIGNLPDGVTVVPTQAPSGVTQVVISYPEGNNTYGIPVNWGGNTTSLQLVSGSITVNDGNVISFPACSTDPVTFTVSASGDWQIISQIPSWLSFNPTEGAAGDTTVTVTPSGGTDSVNDAVIFALKGTFIIDTLNLFQPACMQTDDLRITFNNYGEIVTSRVTITVDGNPTDYDVPAEGYSVLVPINQTPKEIGVVFASYTEPDGGVVPDGKMSLSANLGIDITGQCTRTATITVNQISSDMLVNVQLLTRYSNCQA